MPDQQRPARPRAVAPVRLDELGLAAPGTAGGEAAVTGVAADSRLVCPGDLYLALPGSTRHGAEFAAAAVRAGAVAVLTDPAAADRVAGLGVPVLTAEDPSRRQAALAAAVYGHPSRSLTTFGATGTNGKTTTTYLLAAALRAAGHRCGLVGTVGFLLDAEPIEAPRTTVTTPQAPELQALLRLFVERGADSVAMEVSSHSLSTGRVDEIVFDVAGFTNFGTDHLDFHGSVEAYFAAKADLFTARRAKAAVIAVDDARGPELVRRSLADGLTVFTTATSPACADYVVVGRRANPDGSSAIRLATPDGVRELTVGLPGEFNVRNAVTAYAMLAAAGIDADRGATGLAEARVPGRMERVRLPADAPLVFVDFAHTPQAIAAALSAVTGIGGVGGRRLLAVLGAGGDRDPAKRPAMGAAATAADLVLVTDDNPRSEPPERIRAQVLAGARKAAGTGSATVVDAGDRRSAIRRALADAGPDDVVVILGKGHEQGQEVAGEVRPFADASVVVEEWAALAGQVVAGSGSA